MYTRPVFYKAYSVVVFVLTVLGCLGTLIFTIVGGNVIAHIFPGNTITALYVIVGVVAALVSLFFAYVEFSSMYTFAQMIEHEQSGSKDPFRRMSMVLPPKFYKVFGNVLFYIPLIVDLISVVAMTIMYSVTKHAFLAVPIIPIVGILISLFLTYITYYCRFRTFADLLELKSSKEVKASVIRSLGENKPNILRGYCVFLFVLAIIVFVGAIISLFIVSGPLATVVGSGLTALIDIGIVIFAAVMFMVYGIIGCYYDNLAKMLEHYMIENKLI